MKKFLLLALCMAALAVNAQEKGGGLAAGLGLIASEHIQTASNNSSMKQKKICTRMGRMGAPKAASRGFRMKNFSPRCLARDGREWMAVPTKIKKILPIREIFVSL